LPLFSNDIVPSAGPLEFLFLGAVPAKHVDKPFIITHSLPS